MERAPAIAVHPTGTVVNAVVTGAEHRNHACTKVGAGVPVHVPVDNVHVDPTAANPDTDGATVFIGAIGPFVATVVGAPDSTLAAEFVAASCAVRYFPASAAIDT